MSDDTSDLVLAAVDGELVNQALGRLSTRHRHVLAMREGSGWTYQQIADHEGVEIGTIETLLWRARQALKREFAVVSESKEALAGFLVATGAVLRRTVFRVAHRGATMQQGASNGTGGGGGIGLRNAMAGVAVTGAAVAAAIITPHALSSAPTHGVPLAAPAAAAAANPSLPLAVPGPIAVSSTSGGSGAPAAVTGNTGASAASPLTGALGAGSGTGTSSGTSGGGSTTLPTLPSGRSSGGPGGSGGSYNLPSTPVGKGLTTLTTGVANTLNTVTGGLTNSVGNTLGSAVNGLASALGVTNLLSEIGLTPSTAAPAGATGTSTATGTSASGSTTTTTAPGGLLGQLGSAADSTVKTLLGGN